MPTVDYGSGRSEFEIELKYFDGEPVIREIDRVSKPGRRVYVAVDGSADRLQRARASRSCRRRRACMSDADARAQNVGGEVLCTVF